MKTKKIIKKVSRYLVLSKEFEQDADDLFEERAVDYSSGLINGTGSITIGGSCSSYTGFTSNVTAQEAKTRAEVILEEAKIEASRSDRYDEYKKLQGSLSEYFEALKKVECK